jgi:hypothetical protein
MVNNHSLKVLLALAALFVLGGCSTDAGSNMSAKDAASLKDGSYKNIKRPPQVDEAMKGPGAGFHSSLAPATGAPTSTPGK